LIFAGVNFVRARQGGAPSAEEDLTNAKKQVEAKDEAENPPRRGKTLQGYSDGQNFTHAFGQAALHGNEGSRQDAQAQKAHTRESGGHSKREAAASLRLNDLVFAVEPGSASRVPAGRRAANRKVCGT
jgi:hypothetical protein